MQRWARLAVGGRGRVMTRLCVRAQEVGDAMGMARDAIAEVQAEQEAPGDDMADLIKDPNADAVSALVARWDDQRRLRVPTPPVDADDVPPSPSVHEHINDKIEQEAIDPLRVDRRGDE